MPFSGGQYGPDAQIDTLGNALSGAVVTVPDGYVSALDALGNLTITGPATDALTYTITPVGGTPIARTVRVEPLVAELTSQLGGGGTSGTGIDSTQVGATAAASGDLSIALGVASTASGRGSMTLGMGAVTTADDAVTIGQGAANSGDSAIVLGTGAAADAAHAVVIGEGAGASSTATNSVVLGTDAGARGHDAVVLGNGAGATGNRSIALGAGAGAVTDDTCVISADSVEVVASSGGSQTAFILADSSGARWKITVGPTGTLTTTAL